MLDTKIETRLASMVADARAAFGADLVSVVLYGSAAGSDFHPATSDLNLAIVVERVTLAHLRVLGDHLPRWHRWGAAPPLFVERSFVTSARDVFPIEILDIQEERRLLFGSDIFADLVVSSEDVRRQLEYEARSKLLRLRLQFAECGGRRRAIRALMHDSAKSFSVLMRAFLRLRGLQAPHALMPLVQLFSAELRADFAGLRTVFAVAAEEAVWERDSDAAFAAYLCDIEAFVALVDEHAKSSSRADAKA